MTSPIPPHKKEKDGPFIIAGAIILTLLGFVGFVLKIIDTGLGSVIAGLSLFGLVWVMASGKTKKS